MELLGDALEGEVGIAVILLGVALDQVHQVPVLLLVGGGGDVLGIQEGAFFHQAFQVQAVQGLFAGLVEQAEPIHHRPQTGGEGQPEVFVGDLLQLLESAPQAGELLLLLEEHKGHAVLPQVRGAAPAVRGEDLLPQVTDGIPQQAVLLAALLGRDGVIRPELDKKHAVVGGGVLLPQGLVPQVGGHLAARQDTAEVQGIHVAVTEVAVVFHLGQEALQVLELVALAPGGRPTRRVEALYQADEGLAHLPAEQQGQRGVHPQHQQKDAQQGSAQGAVGLQELGITLGIDEPPAQGVGTGKIQQLASLPGAGEEIFPFPIALNQLHELLLSQGGQGELLWVLHPAALAVHYGHRLALAAVLYGEAEAAHVHVYDDGAAVGGELVHKGDYLIAAGLVVENNAPAEDAVLPAGAGAQQLQAGL